MATTNYGVYGWAAGGTTNWAGYFDGDVRVTGTFDNSKSSLVIDHPVDPENKYLYHSSVVSPDMKTVYDGIVTLDVAGEAVVQLPDYFDALNGDFRYQLTCLGGYAPVYVADELPDNQFRIAGGAPGMKVSWQVTGIRKDAFAEANRTQVEVNKPDSEKGLYMHPEAFGLGEEMEIHYETHKAAMQSAEKAQENHGE